MANNRMWLQVKDKPEKKVLLAKYYPSTGWYIFHTEKELNEWFKKNFNFEDAPDQDWVDGQWGRVDVELVFEANQGELKEIRKELKSLGDEKNDTNQQSTNTKETTQSPPCPGVREYKTVPLEIPCTE